MANVTLNIILQILREPDPSKHRKYRSLLITFCFMGNGRKCCFQNQLASIHHSFYPLQGQQFAQDSSNLHNPQLLQVDVLNTFLCMRFFVLFLLGSKHTIVHHPDIKNEHSPFFSFVGYHPSLVLMIFREAFMLNEVKLNALLQNMWKGTRALLHNIQVVFMVSSIIETLCHRKDSNA